jgi:hypothetical protein
MAKYKMGRACVATLPGVSNNDIKDVTVNASATELDVTTFPTTGSLTKADYMPGLVDVTIDVTCTDTTATVGMTGAQDVANIDTTLEAVVLDVKESVSPKGVVEYTVTYGLQTPEV